MTGGCESLLQHSDIQQPFPACSSFQPHIRRWFSLCFLPMCGISMQFLGFSCIGPENPQTSFLPAYDKKEEHEAYKMWCEDNALHALAANRLRSELAQNEKKCNVEATNNIYLAGGKRVRGFVGIEVLVRPSF